MTTNNNNSELQKLDFHKSYAFIIGIDQYKNVRSLENAVNDAERLADVLEKQQGFEVHTPLTDATGAKIRELIEKTIPGKVVDKKDRVLFYFSGHGIALDGENGPTGYLVPADAEPLDTNSLISMKELHKSLSELPCKHMLVVLDCCFAGAFKWSGGFKDIAMVPKRIYKDRFDRYIQDPAWQVITSAAYDQKAWDVLQEKALGHRGKHDALEGKHSPFAMALFNGLSGQADIIPAGAGDGVITATELYLYLREQVEPRTIEYNEKYRQTPGIFPLEKHDKGEFIFLHPRHRLNLPPILQRNPYKGLHPFEFKKEDIDLFYGREKVIKDLMKKVSENKLVVVTGASGTGKSSVVKAGLAPGLEKQGYEILPIFRPGNNPIAAIEEVLCKSKLLDASISADNDVTSIINRLTLGCKRVLVIDQYEELITQCRKEAERNRFTKILKNLLDADKENRLEVIITVRADYEPQFEDGELKTYWKEGRYTVPPFSQDELREIILKPANQEVLIFEPGELVEDIINEVIQAPGALPLLSFTLSELYRLSIQKVRGRVLHIDNYRELGGVVGALRTRADYLYENLGTEDRQTLEKIMLRMVSLENGEMASQRVYDEELIFPGQESEKVKTVIDKLVEAHLVIRGQDAKGKPYTEPAHDALIRAWKKIREWINNIGEEYLLLHNRLREEVKDLEVKKSFSLTKKNLSALKNQGVQEDIIKKIKELKNHKYENEEEFIKSLESAIGVKLESTHKTLILERLDTKKHYSKGSLWDSNPRLDQLTEIREELRKGWFNQRENDFISASIDLRDWKRKRRNRITTAAISVLSVLLIIAIISYLNAKSQKREALRQLVRINWVNGVNERDKNQDDLKACHYFMKAASIPVDLDLSKNAPLAGAYLMRNIKLHAIIKCDGKILKSFLSHDKKKVTTFSSDGYIRQWDIESGAASAEPIKTEQIVNAQYIDANKGYILLWYNDDTVQAWDTISRTPISVPIKYGCMVIGATISHDKKRILIWSKDNKVGPAIWLPENRFGKKECISTSRIFNCQTGAPLTKLMKHDFQLRGAIFLKKQPSVLTWGMDKIVRLWDINMGEQIASPIKHDRQENPLISRDEKIIITWGEHGGIAGALRRENNNYVSTAYPIHKDIINGAVFNKDQSMVLSWSQDGTIRVWNPYNGKPIFTVPQMHKQAVFGAAFNKDESEILSWSLDGTARLWDSQSGRELIPPLRHSELVRGGIFNKDESKIMTWSIDGITKVWDIRTDSPMVVSITHGNTVREASFCNDEKRIMTWINGILDGTVNLWDSSTGARLIPTIKQIGREFGATVCKNGNRIITWSDEDIKVWDICPSDFFVKSLEGDIRGAILSNDENLMLTWSLDGTAQVRDSYTGKIISKLPHRFSSPLTSRDYCTGEPGIEPTPAPGKDIDGAFFFRNGTRILAWSGNGLMQIFDSITGKLAAKPMTHKKSGQVSFLTPSVQVTFLSKDESRLFTKADKKVWVWDIEKGEKLFPPLEHPGTVWDIEYNEEKNLILTTASSNIRDYQLNLWSGMTGKIIIQPITTKNGSIRNLSFNKDGTLFFYSTGDSLFVRSTQTGELYSKPIRANYTIQGVLYSKNHKYALLWYTNNIAELWDISQAKSMSGLMKHDYFIHNAQFNKDESRILVCASPTVQVWSCPSGRLITPAMIHDSDIDYAVFGNDGKTLLTLTKTGTASIWDGDTGKLVIPPMKYHEAVNGAVFNKIENRFLVWDKDVKAIMRQFKINNDYPKECLLLQAEVHTGTRLNDAGDIEVLPADQWYEKKRKLEALLKKQK